MRLLVWTQKLLWTADCLSENYSLCPRPPNCLAPLACIYVHRVIIYDNMHSYMYSSYNM